MEQNQFIANVLLVSIVWLIILYFIIKEASGAKQRKAQLHLQNKILIEIAKKSNVDQQTIDDLNLENSKYY